LKYLTKAADQGHAEANCILATFYGLGFETEKNKEKVLFHFSIAAEKGVKQPRL
jgi:TPR repeat protein